MIAERYDWEKIAEKTMDVYIKVTQKRKMINNSKGQKQ